MPPRSLLNAQRDGTLACKVVAATVFGAYRRDGPCNAGWIRTAATRLCFLLQHGQRKGIFVPLVRLVLLRSEEHTSELQSRENLVCRLLLEKKKNTIIWADRYAHFVTFSPYDGYLYTRFRDGTVCKIHHDTDEETIGRAGPE